MGTTQPSDHQREIGPPAYALLQTGPDQALLPFVRRPSPRSGNASRLAFPYCPTRSLFDAHATARRSWSDYAANAGEH